MTDLQLLRVLILEDNPLDAALMVDELRQAGFDPVWERVDSEADYLVKLDTVPDVILADYNLIQWDVTSALRAVQARGLDVPMIIVSANMSEEAAIECIRQGAADYLLRDRLARLGGAVRKALEDQQRRLEKLHADAALRESETRYRRLFEAAKDGILILDAVTGQILDVNPFLLDLLGYGYDEFLHKAIWDIGLFSDLIASRDAFTQLTLTEYIRYDDLALRRKDGEQVAVEFVSNIYRAGGQSVIQCNIRDISQRKRTEAELAQYRDQLEQMVEQRTDELNRAKTRLEAIFNNTTDGIVLVFPERGIEQQNSTFNLLFTCEPDDYFGQPLLNLVHAADRERLAAMIESVRADRGARRDEYRALRVDGSSFDARIGIGSIIAEGSLSTGLVCSVQDIRILKQRERELRYHASLQESVTDAVVSNDVEFHIQTWNAAAERIYGWSAEEVIGKTVQEVVQTQFSDEAREQVVRVLWAEGHWQGQVVQRHKDGSRLHILTAISVFKDQYGEPLGIVGVNHDITWRVETEQALQIKLEAERAFQSYLIELHQISLELTQIDPLDDFYKQVIELGLSRLGFERLALFLYDESADSAQGTYGTNSHGQIEFEHAFRFTPDPQGVLMRALGQPEQFYLEESTSLYQDAMQVGLGWNAAAPLRIGNRVVGWLVADNLIEHKPTSKPQLEVFALYALTIAAQLARKQAVADLRDSEALFRSFVEAAPEGIVICNRQGVITLVNAQAETLFGYRRDELIGQAVELLLPVAQRDGHRQHREQYATAPYQRPAAALPELPARRKDGSQFLAAIQLSAVPKQDELLVISFITDVTERNWAEQALRASEVHLRELQQLLHTVIETLPVRVFWKDRDSNYLGSNQLFALDAGLTASEQLVGKSDFDFPWISQAPAYRADDQAVMESGFPRLQVEEQMTRVDGSTIWVLTNKSPLRDSSGAIIGLIGGNVDITELKRTEAALERALEEQKQLVDLKSRFISMASHDFRTPLSVILSSSDLLKMQITRQFGADQLEPLQKRFGRIDESVQQITNLLDDVLTVNRSDTGNVEIHPEWVELKSFCASILEEIQVAASAEHVIRSAFVGTATSIRSDRQLLRQILVNLLSNAVKYSPDGGKVLLDVHCEPERVAFRVQDEGIGIPEDDQARLFEVFHRAHNVEDIHGTGLGMAIVKRAVDALGGSIEFESQVGVGTAFMVNLPATPDSKN